MKKAKYEFDDLLTFSTTNEFVGVLKDNVYAIYSAKLQKLITDFDYNEIRYMPKDKGYKEGNYFLVRKDNSILMIDSNGKVMNFPLTSTKNHSLKIEQLWQYRFRNGVGMVSDKNKVGIVDTKTGKMIIPYIYKTMTRKSDTTFLATTFDDKEKVINTEDLLKENLSV